MKPDDVVVVEAGEERENSGRSLSDVPRDTSAPGQAGFKLLRPDDAVVVEAEGEREDSERSLAGVAVIEAGDVRGDSGRSIDSEIPIDTSESGQAGFKLLKPDDFVVVEAGLEEGRALSDIPRDNSGLNKAGFKLPLPDSEVESDDAIIVENEGSPRKAKNIIPHDDSSANTAGFRLPKSEEHPIELANAEKGIWKQSIL